MRVAAEEAVRPVREAIERRELEERLIRWAIQELPFTKTEADKAEPRPGCAEILAQLPDDVAEWEAKKEV